MSAGSFSGLERASLLPQREDSYPARELFDLVSGKPGVSYHLDGEIVQSPLQKICILVRQIGQELRELHSVRQPTLAYAALLDGKEKEKGFKLVKKLAGLIWVRPKDHIAQLVLYALEKLKKYDESIELVIRSSRDFIQKMRATNLGKAPKFLVHFVQKEKGLTLDLPLKPICLSPRALPLQEPFHPFWKIQKICFGAIKDDDYQIFRQNLEEIANQESFVVPNLNLKNGRLEWLCDPMLLVNGTPYLPQHLFDPQSAKEEIYQALCQTSNSPMGMVANRRTTDHLITEFPEDFRLAPFYFEGGNILETVDRKGQRYFLVGASNVLFSLINMVETFSPAERESIIEKAKQMNPCGVDQMDELETSLWSLDSFHSWSNEKLRRLVQCIYAGVPDVVEKMRKTLPGKVLIIGNVFEDQPEFHIDMFMCPAPGGRIFIHDYCKALTILSRILQRKDLTHTEREQLMSYYEQMQSDGDLYQGQIERISETLKGEGFRVIPVAGLINSKKGQVQVCYMNAIFGQNDQGTYCITNGSLESVDRFFREAFLDDLRREGINRVYFTGRKTRGEISKFGGFPYWVADKSLANSGGIHCRVQVLRDERVDYREFLDVMENMPSNFSDHDLPRQASFGEKLRAALELEPKALMFKPLKPAFSASRRPISQNVCYSTSVDSPDTISSVSSPNNSGCAGSPDAAYSASSPGESYVPESWEELYSSDIGEE